MPKTELPFNFVEDLEFASQLELETYIYKFITVNAAETYNNPDIPVVDGSTCLINETRTIYYYAISAGSYVIDHQTVLATFNGGNTRWIAKAGKYSATGISFGNGTLIINDGDELKFIDVNGTNLLSDFLGSALPDFVLGDDGALILTDCGKFVLKE